MQGCQGALQRKLTRGGGGERGLLDTGALLRSLHRALLLTECTERAGVGGEDRRATEESREKVEGGVDGSNLQELGEYNGASRFPDN